jgi:hypothetical protein
LALLLPPLTGIAVVVVTGLDDVLGQRGSLVGVVEDLPDAALMMRATEPGDTTLQMDVEAAKEGQDVATVVLSIEILTALDDGAVGGSPEGDLSFQFGIGDGHGRCGHRTTASSDR